MSTTAPAPLTLDSFQVRNLPASEWSLAEELVLSGDWDAALEDLTEDQAKALEYDWSFWGRPDQQEPEEFASGAIKVWFIRAGRGYGKTRTGSETVKRRVRAGKAGRLAIVAPTAGDARDIMVEGESGILAVHPDWWKPDYEPSKRRITWPNGAVATVFSADEPDRLRGPQYDFVWGDEPACLPGGAMVETEGGPKAIEAIRAGEMVWTRAGLRRVVWSGPTRPDASLIRLVTTAGDLVCTPDHRVWTDAGWVEAQNVAPGDSLASWTNTSSPARPPGSPGEDAATTAIARATTRTARAISSIATSMRRASARWRRTTTSTTGTRTRPTTARRTWSAWRTASTPGSTTSRPPRPSPLSGTREWRRLAPSGSGQTECREPWSALDAESPSGRPACAPSSARPRVERATVVAVERSPRRLQTYDLSVEGEHEFFADGFLVHNSWRFGEEAWDNIEFGLRLGLHPQALLTGTPRPLPWLKAILNDEETIVTVGSSFRNIPNLAESFIRRILKKYEGTRLGLQELHAMVLEDVEGALWTRSLIDVDRVRWVEAEGGLVLPVPDLDVVVVAVDPAVSSGPDSDETGIVVGGRVGSKSEGHAYILGDYSLRGSPIEWARAVVAAVEHHGADHVVAEKNNGGDLVRTNIHAVAPRLKVNLVSASRGKKTRAEPVSTMYELHRVHHVGLIDSRQVHVGTIDTVAGEEGLETQMVEWVPGETDDSPDRVDALVWLVTDLLDVDQGRKKVRIIA